MSHRIHIFGFLQVFTCIISQQERVIYRFSYEICPNDPNYMTPLTLYSLHRFQIFGYIDSSLKYVSSVLDSKKVDYTFEEPLNLHINVSQFFSSNVYSRRKCVFLKKPFNLISRLRWRVQYPRYTEYIHYFYQQLQ